MTKYVIHGGKPLFGEIDISGAKNAAVAIIPAALLVDGVCRIENIPQISDVTLILNILQELGADVRTVNRTTVDVDCSHIRNARVPEELDERLLAALTGPDDGVVVSGPAPAGGVPSTIVEPLAGTDLRVLRLGAVSLEALKAAGFTPHLA